MLAIILNDKLPGITMSKPVHEVTEDVAVIFPNNTTTQRGRPKATAASANCSDPLTAALESSVDDVPTAGKRTSVYPLQRRGSRKKTLSLNPEEREALENLIEEVIMGGVGEGVIDSDVSSSDEEDEFEDAELPASAESSVPGSSMPVTVGDPARQDPFVKGGKKFYPGQLKVALKHMHDLPPRFVRKLAKAQQYLDAGGGVYLKPVVSVGRIEEEEEVAAHSRDDSNPTVSTAGAAMPAASALERDRDKTTRVKEHKLKDAKKVIRTLLTDRDQYIDETVGSAVVSSQSVTADIAYLTNQSASGDHLSQKVPQYRQYDTTATQAVVSNSVPISENSAFANATSFSSTVTCSSNAHVYYPSGGVNVSNRPVEYIPKTVDANYRASQTSHPSPSGSQPIPIQSFQPPVLGIPQYQVNVPVVHGMKPAPVLGQSPPGTQYWIPQAVVSSSAPGYYGSSPPVVGAFNQLVPYAYSVQSSYPTVQGVHASYTPQYLYSASPPSQGLIGPASFNQPVSYSLSVLPPEHYVRPPRAMSPNFYQSTPPPGYCATQSCPASGQRHVVFTNKMSPPQTDGARTQMIAADYTHNLSALSVPVMASHQPPPVQPVICSIDTRTGHTKPVFSVSPGISTSLSREMCCPSVTQPNTRHSAGYHSPDTGGKIMPNFRSHARHSSPDSLHALNSHRQRFSKSPVTATMSIPNTCLSYPNTTLRPSVSASEQSSIAAQPEVSKVCTIDTVIIDRNASALDICHFATDVHLVDSKPTSLSSLSSRISNTSVLSAESGSEEQSFSETKAKVAGCSEPVIMQESITKERSEFPPVLSSTKSLEAPVSDSGNAATVTPLLSKLSDVVSDDTNDASSSTRRTGDISGESSVKEDGVIDVGSTQDRLPSELPSGLTSLCEEETSDRSLCSESQVQKLSPNPASCSVSPPQPTADILLDCGARNASSPDIVVTLSSSLMSSLVEMFGPPPECDIDHGMPIICRLMTIIPDKVRG